MTDPPACSCSWPGRAWHCRCMNCRRKLLLLAKYAVCFPATNLLLYERPVVLPPRPLCIRDRCLGRRRHRRGGAQNRRESSCPSFSMADFRILVRRRRSGPAPRGAACRGYSHALRANTRQLHGRIALGRSAWHGTRACERARLLDKRRLAWPAAAAIVRRQKQSATCARQD